MFPQQLKALREEAGLTQRQLAERLNVTQGTIGNWENSLREPKLEMIQRLAEIFDTTTDYLLGTSPQRSPQPDEDTPQIYLQLLQGARKLELDQRDVDLLLEIAGTLKEKEREKHRSP